MIALVAAGPHGCGTPGADGGGGRLVLAYLTIALSLVGLLWWWMETTLVLRRVSGRKAYLFPLALPIGLAAWLAVLLFVAGYPVACT